MDNDEVPSINNTYQNNLLNCIRHWASLDNFFSSTKKPRTGPEEVAPIFVICRILFFLYSLSAILLFPWVNILVSLGEPITSCPYATFSSDDGHPRTNKYYTLEGPLSWLNISSALDPGHKTQTANFFHIKSSCPNLEGLWKRVVDMINTVYFVYYCVMLPSPHYSVHDFHRGLNGYLNRKK